MKRKIHQIIPADGIYAVNAASETDITFHRIACWALVDDKDGEQAVCGMTVGLLLRFAEDHVDFDGYVHESELPAISLAMSNAKLDMLLNNEVPDAS